MTASAEKQKTVATGRPVVAVVGAGSLVWGRSIVVDIMCNPDLADAEIRLIDIMPDRLALGLRKSFSVKVIKASI
jgi:alpha-galactosidase/6-phospho-beta-glucosidase family protein